MRVQILQAHMKAILVVLQILQAHQIQVHHRHPNDGNFT